MRRQILNNAKFFTAFVLLGSMIFSACDSVSNTNTNSASASRPDFSTSKTAPMNSNTSSADENLLSEERNTNGERYAEITENPFLETARAPLSTFSIDVDTASYANVRRFLNDG